MKKDLTSQDITKLLEAWNLGDVKALPDLVPLVYKELHRLAHFYMAGERGGHTLQTTALVHEAFIKLGGGKEVDWESRAHFLRFAAQAMRNILIDHARRRAAAKRGGGLRDATLDEEMTPVERQAEQLFFIGEALDELEQMSPRLARVVECRFFAGMTDSETAAALGVSDRTVRRDWTKARACLHAALADGGTGGR